MIEGVPPKAVRGDKVSIDTEFFGQEKRRLHRPHGRFAYLGCSFDGKTVYYTTKESDIQSFLDLLDDAVWIFVNAKYDITQLRRFARISRRKKLWDCMLIEQIMYSGYYTDFSLADLARRYLGVYLTKEVRETFSEDDTASLSREQSEYACVDVAATWRVYKEQRAIIDEDDLSVWKHIELPFLWALLGMRGCKIDKEGWISLCEKNYEDALSIQRKYMDNPEILDEMSLEEAKKSRKFSGLNLASTNQVSERLKELGAKVKGITKGGAMSTQEDDLRPFIDVPFVKDVLEFRGKMKLASTYGRGWIERGYIEPDGRVYSDFKQIGAATGRLSSSDPNVENIPVRDTGDFRRLFVADDGKVLIDADWSAQEPRIFAYQSQDELLLKIFRDKKDVYLEAGRLMFGWEMDKKDPRRKERMKPTVLGAAYGLTEYGMEKKYGIPKEEGKKLMDVFFSTFEGAARYKKEQLAKTSYVQTIYGRKFWLNIYERNYENNALNSPTQGSAADAMKIAGALFYSAVEDAGLSDFVYVINYVHDEILIECDKKYLDWAMNILKDIMISVAEDMHKGIPADVEIGYGRTWAEAHS